MDNLPDHPFTHDDAAVGLTRRQLQHRVAIGQVRRVLRGVYVRADVPDSLELRAHAARLVLPENAVLCDRSAAWLWGIDVLDLAEHAEPPRLETASVSGSDRVRRNGVYGAKRDLREDEVCEIDGVRVTTPVRTACDLACLRGRSSALAAYDAFARQFGLGPADYARQLARYTGRRGVKQARELAAYASGLAESPGESWTRLAIIDVGLRAPDPQVWVELPELGWVRLDLAYEHLKIAVEYDGEEFHSTPEQRAADDHRRSLLRDQGWIVIVVRKGDFTGAGLDAWLGELRAAVAERVPAYTRRYSRGESWDPRRH